MKKTFLRIAAALCLLLCSSFVPTHEFAPSSPIGMNCNTARDFFHRDVYIDPEFTVEERELLDEAMRRWHEQTGGFVEFHVRGSARHQMAIGRYFFGYGESFVIRKVLPEEEFVWPHGILGMTGFGSFVVIPSRISDPEKFVAVSMHEIGHLFGLMHTAEPDDLMFPSCTPDHCAPELSRGDLIQLCIRLRELKEEEEE